MTFLKNSDNPEIGQVRKISTEGGEIISPPFFLLAQVSFTLVQEQALERVVQA